METSSLAENNLLEEQYYSEEELAELGVRYTCQNFSKYLIFKKGNNYYLMDRIDQDKFRVHLNFAD